MWTTKPHVQQRLRERIEAVLEFGKSRGLREGENPARWRGHLENSYAVAVATKNHAALPFGELPAFMAELSALPGVAARALEFTILTASRTREARFARWSEFDLSARVWTIPGSRMKGGRQHRVPLGERALVILAALPARERCRISWSQRGRLPEPRCDGGHAGEVAQQGDGDCSRFQKHVSGLGGGDDSLSEPRRGNGVGARDPERRREVLAARRPVREARAAHGRLGRLLRGKVVVLRR